MSGFLVGLASFCTVLAVLVGDERRSKVAAFLAAVLWVVFAALVITQTFAA